MILYFSFWSFTFLFFLNFFPFICIPDPTSTHISVCFSCSFLLTCPAQFFFVLIFILVLNMYSDDNGHFREVDVSKIKAIHFRLNKSLASDALFGLKQAYKCTCSLHTLAERRTRASWVCDQNTPTNANGLITDYCHSFIRQGTYCRTIKNKFADHCKFRPYCVLLMRVPCGRLI